jgi:N-acetyl-anhydromuramyl-L-alanine amidase AmpD
MSYSSLVSYVKLSPNRTKPRAKKIDTITIHHMAGNLSVEACGEVFSPRTRSASSNYGIGSDGRIACYVEEENAAWTSSSSANDSRAITIEVANNSGSPEWTVSAKAYEALIDLCVDICKRYKFRLNYTGDKKGNLTMHRWFASTLCPGPYLEPRFPEIAAEVNKRLGEEIAPAKPIEKKEECTVNVLVLRKGSKGTSVKALQALLITNGCYCGIGGVDGDFGSATEKAVRQFQAAKKLDVDGIVGSKTWQKLLEV